MPEAETWDAPDHEADDAPERIGAYRILSQIGEGGFGVVYEAEQTEPVHRRVALKLIKRGMDSKAIVARFEAERQALALMDHPCVAKIFDGGVTKDGRPYFVMEMVRGLPLTEHCDRHRLSVDERIELFISVCNSVQHAHSKGVIHRDLKPSNVLIEYEDGKSTPKVIDFGVAKALSQRLTEATIFTQQGVFIGTPEYMSPEQAGMSEQGVDTRSDVYSLGVMLYELLVGVRPFNSEALREAGLGEIQRIIREVEPPKPSTRLGSVVGEDASMSSDIAESRRTETRSLASVLRRDLDWVVMRCLEKDRERRYETANALAMELGRFLRSEPVLAGPPSVRYRMGKFVRRNRGGVIAGGVIAATLVAATGVSVWFGVVAEGHRSKAEQALIYRDKALEAEREQTRIAERREQEADAARASEAKRAAELKLVADFQDERLGDIDVQMMGIGLRRSLIDAAPEERREQLEQSLSGINFTSIALGALEDNIFGPTIEAIDGQFEDQPLVRAQLLQSAADTMRELGYIALAIGPQERALEIRRIELARDHRDLLDSMSNMGQLLIEQHHFSEAEVYFKSVLDRTRAAFGDGNPNTLAAANNMGALLRARGQLSAAEDHYREALEGARHLIAADHPGALALVGNMGQLLHAQGELSEAERFYLDALEGLRRCFGDEHPSTLSLINNMGQLLQSQGRLSEAEAYFLEALNGSRRVLGDDHPDTLISANNMGSLLMSQGRLSESEAYFRESLEGFRRSFGSDHPYTLGLIRHFGVLLQSAGRFSEAEAYFVEELEGLRRSLGANHPNTLASMNNLGSLLHSQGRLTDSEMYYAEALERARRTLGNDNPATLSAILSLGTVLEGQGRLDEAEPLYRESIERGRRVNGDEHPDSLYSVRCLGRLLEKQGRLSESEEYRRLAETLSRRLEPNGGQRLGSALVDLGVCLLKQSRYADSILVLSECLEIRRRTMPEGHWIVWNTQSLLGEALAAESEYERAEALLIESANNLEPPERYRTLRRAEAIQRVVDLYAQWHTAEPGAGYDAKASEWQAKLDEIQSASVSTEGDD